MYLTLKMRIDTVMCHTQAAKNILLKARILSHGNQKKTQNTCFKGICKNF